MQTQSDSIDESMTTCHSWHITNIIINVAKIWCKLSDFIFLSPQRDVLWLNIKHAGARCPSNNAQFILTQRCGSTRGGGCGQELCVRPHFAKWRTLVRFVNISLICENWSDLQTLFRFVIFIVWSKKQIYYEMMKCWNVSGFWMMICLTNKNKPT